MSASPWEAGNKNATSEVFNPFQKAAEISPILHVLLQCGFAHPPHYQEVEFIRST
jgi:hypothetical protein